MRRINCKDKKHWLSERQPGIGGSDASTIVGENPYKTLSDLYLEKIGVKTSPDISNKPAVAKGVRLEPIIRDLCKIAFPEYQFYHNDYELLVDDEYDFLRASVDSEITSPLGMIVHEIKTATIKNSQSYSKWINGIPNYYYCQVLHYLSITKYPYALVSAYLMYEQYVDQLPKSELIHYLFEYESCQDDIDYLRKHELAFWHNNVQAKVMPEITISL